MGKAAQHHGWRLIVHERPKTRLVEPSFVPNQWRRLLCVPSVWRSNVTPVLDPLVFPDGPASFVDVRITFRGILGRPSAKVVRPSPIPSHGVGRTLVGVWRPGNSDGQHRGHGCNTCGLTGPVTHPGPDWARLVLSRQSVRD